MLKVSDGKFRELVSDAIDSLPKQYTENMKNVAVIVEDEPALEQKNKLHLLDGETLYGLYEGIPLTERSGNYNLVLPDKITIFKNPMLINCPNIDLLKKQILRTVWHEIAHHYGLDHKRIHELQNKTG
jgi:predicted Zn-dependent protease with MMP-like domain